MKKQKKGKRLKQYNSILPELKYWWAKKSIEVLKSYEKEDQSLDLEKAQGNVLDIVGRLSHFQNSKDEDLYDLIMSYFTFPWGVGDPYISHEDARKRIQIAYRNNRNNLIKFLKTYNQDENQQINDFVKYFNLNEVEKDILFFVFCNACMENSFFVLSTSDAKNIFEEMNIVTGHRVDELKMFTTNDSTLIKEKIFSLYGNRVIFNTDWDEYLLKSEVKKSTAEKKYRKLRRSEIKKLKENRNELLDDLDDPPYDLFLGVERIETHFCYPNRKYFKVTLGHDSVLGGYNPLGVVIQMLNITILNRDISYKLDPKNKNTIIDGHLNIFISESDFLNIIKTLKKDHSNYYQFNFLPKINLVSFN